MIIKCYYKNWYLVIILYQYYELVDLLIKKERSRMDWSLYIVLQFLQSRDEIINNKNLKDKEIELGKESNKNREKRESEIETNNERVITSKENDQEDKQIHVERRG